MGKHGETGRYSPMNLTGSFGIDSTSIKEELTHSQRLNIQVICFITVFFPKNQDKLQPGGSPLAHMQTLPWYRNLMWIIIKKFLSHQALMSRNARRL